MRPMIRNSRELLDLVSIMEKNMAGFNTDISRLKSAKSSISQPADNQLLTWDAELSMLVNSNWHLPADDGAAGDIFYTDGAGNLDWIAPGAAAVAGADTEIQFNLAGVMGAEAAFTYDYNTNTMAVDNISAETITAEVVTITNVSSVGSDPNKFLVLDASNNVDRCNGAELLLYLSGDAALPFNWNNQDLDDCGNIGIGRDATLSSLDILHGSDDDEVIIMYGNDTTTEYLAFGIDTNEAIITAGTPGAIDVALVFKTSDAGAEAEAGRFTPEGILNLSSVADAGTDTNKFLVRDVTGNVDYRTGTETLADLSGDAAASFDWNGQELDNCGHIGIGDAAQVSYSIYLDHGSYRENIVLIFGADSTSEYLGLGVDINEAILTAGHGSDADNTDLVLRAYNSGTEFEAMRIKYDGAVGINESDPYGKFDINSGEITLFLGSDSGSTDGVRTDNSTKRAHIGSIHYDIDAAGVCLASMSNTSTSNIVNIGGGGPFLNAATWVHIYTAANTTTSPGTLQFSVAPDGGVFMYNLATASADTDINIDSTTHEIFEVSSSIRFKENVRDTEVDSTVLQDIELKSYDWKKDKSIIASCRGKKDFGFVAEQVYSVFPALCSLNSNGEVKNWKTTKVLELAVAEIQRLNKEIEALKKELSI